nr:DUF5107 domain-containing protein [Fodinicola feengrottensis]
MCAPCAGWVSGPKGVPVLRMWEYERLRRMVVQLDAWLPPDSRVLFVRPRLHNPHRETIPVYWWSNVAVPETDATRVLAPADTAWQFGYEAELRKTPVPGPTDGYPARAATAADYFYDIPDDRAGWIAAVDENGDGFFQTSTRPMRGRKLFFWGTGQGGRRWQEWLGDGRYLEIQAGLARTQLEHVPMPAGETWSWTEAYGPIAVDAQVAHGDWTRASQAAGEAVARVIPATDLSTVDTEAARWGGASAS